MSNSGHSYIHGYSPEEQRRLLAQAEYWRDDLILPDLPYKPGESLLEMGCGVGAVLKVLGEAHPKLKLSGIDLSERQIALAREVLAGRDVDLRVGDATALPYADNTFDHVYMMWFLEHLPDPVAVLREALRVLKPGGSIIANECDYTLFQLKPFSPDFHEFLMRFCEVFAKSGWNNTSSVMGEWFVKAGFQRVVSKPMGFRWTKDDDLPGCIEYILGFMEPSLGDMAGDKNKLLQGIADFRAAGTNPDAEFYASVKRAMAFKAS